jgi:hypothetical protein
LSEEESNDSKIVLLVVANIILWTAAGVVWTMMPQWRNLRLGRQLYMLVRPHALREDERVVDMVLEVQRQDVV